MFGWLTPDNGGSPARQMRKRGNRDDAGGRKDSIVSESKTGCSGEDMVLREPEATKGIVGNNKENSGTNHLIASSQTLERIRQLTIELNAAKEDAQAAAEIGQQLLSQGKAKSDEIENLKNALNEQHAELSTLREQLSTLSSENVKVHETLEETKAECELLMSRNVQLSQKLETVNREALRTSAALADYENRLGIMTKERDFNAKKVAELQSQIIRMKIGDRSNRPSIGSSVASQSPRPSSARSLRVQALHNAPGKSSGHDELDAEDSDSDCSLLPETPKGNTRLVEQLSAARAENEFSKRRIVALESALEEHSLERQKSVRKMQSLERNLTEYQEIMQAQSELQTKDHSEENIFSDFGMSLEAILLQEELGKLKDRAQRAEVLAALREEDLDSVINQLLELEERLYNERGNQGTLRRKRANRKMYATCDMGVGTEDESVPQLIDLELADPEVPAVQRNGYSGPLLVKFGKKSRFGMSSQKWRARLVELRGPHLLFFRNEWDTKPSKVIPIDGTEVRVVRRPHRENTAEGSFADRDFKLDRSTLKRTKKSNNRFQSKRGGAAARSHSFTSLFLPNSHSQQIADMDRAGRVVHEFHLWHPRRPVVYFSAPTHDEMSIWAEHIQRQSTSVAVRPRRFAAGYLTVMGDYSNDRSHHLTRFFAVLRSDGIHLYTHPRKRTSVRVILLDSHARVWKPEAKRKASLLFEDLGRTFCIQTTEQGRSTLQADTDVDCDWWVNTLKAHGMGVVSWGSVTGIRDDEPFGCLNI